MYIYLLKYKIRRTNKSSCVFLSRRKKSGSSPTEEHREEKHIFWAEGGWGTRALSAADEMSLRTARQRDRIRLADGVVCFFILICKRIHTLPYPASFLLRNLTWRSYIGLKHTGQRWGIGHIIHLLFTETPQYFCFIFLCVFLFEFFFFFGWGVGLGACKLGWRRVNFVSIAGLGISVELPNMIVTLPWCTAIIRGQLDWFHKCHTAGSDSLIN